MPKDPFTAADLVALAIVLFLSAYPLWSRHVPALAGFF